MSVSELSFEDMPASKELSQGTAITPLHGQHETVLAELAENMQQQQQNRMEKKLERVVRQKEAIIGELSSRCSQLEKEKKTIATINKTLTTQYNEIRSAFQQSSKEAEDKVERGKEEQEQAMRQVERMNGLLKEQVAELQKENAKLKSREELQSQDHSRKVKRLQLAWQDKNKALESKLKVREEQQSKVEEMLTQKKKHYGQDMAEKEQVIAQLIDSNRALQESIIKAKEESISYQRKYQHMKEQLELKVSQLGKRIEQSQIEKDKEAQKNKTVIETVKTAIDTLADSLNLESQAQNVPQRLKLIKDELKQVIKNSNMDKVHSLQTEIASLKKQQEELNRKLKIAEEEAEFVKSMLTKKQEATNIIKQHLEESKKEQATKPTTIKQPSMSPPHKKLPKTFEKKTSQCQSPQDIKWKDNLAAFMSCKDKIDSFLGQSALQNRYHSLENRTPPQHFPGNKSCQLEQSTPRFDKHRQSVSNLGRSGQVQEEFSRQLSRKARLEAEDCQKRRAEWQRRRQSLVYVMYRRLPAESQQQEQAQPPFQSRHDPNLRSSRRGCGRRSGSMKDLVRRSCQSRLD